MQSKKENLFITAKAITAITDYYRFSYPRIKIIIYASKTIENMKTNK